MTLPFRGLLKLGSTGTQPVAVKRGLYKAGYQGGWGGLDGYGIAAKVLGLFAVRQLKKFQHDQGLPVDGVYGPLTHRRLTPFFDDYAEFLYLKEAPVLGPTVQLPKSFTATHMTAGLEGYPAIDVFAKPKTFVLAPEAGQITRLSGHDPKEGGVPGGAYGWSMYLTVPHGSYYLTHFGSRSVKEGDNVRQGQILGTVCDAKVAGMNSTDSHIHEGKQTL